MDGGRPSNQTPTSNRILLFPSAKKWAGRIPAVRPPATYPPSAVAAVANSLRRVFEQPLHGSGLGEDRNKHKERGRLYPARSFGQLASHAAAHATRARFSNQSFPLSRQRGPMRTSGGRAGKQPAGRRDEDGEKKKSGVIRYCARFTLANALRKGELIGKR